MCASIGWKQASRLYRSSEVDGIQMMRSKNNVTIWRRINVTAPSLLEPMRGAAFTLTMLASIAWAQNVPTGPGPLGPPDPVDEIVRVLPPPTIGLELPTDPLPADAPKSSTDPRNFEGTWFHQQTLEFRIQKDMYGSKVPFNMAGAKVLARRVNSLPAGTPYINASTICRPPGQVWQLDLNNPFQIYQSNESVDILFEWYHGIWKIPLESANSPPANSQVDSRDYMGRSVGRWDGNTLVIESSGFKQALWLDVNGTPASANAKLTQRVRKVLDQGSAFLEIVTVIDDPTYYKRAWSIVRTFAWRPDMMIFDEYNCEEQVGDKNYLPVSGLIPEPKD